MKEKNRNRWRIWQIKEKRMKEGEKRSERKRVV
jgi:hypothetical protein